MRKRRTNWTEQKIALLVQLYPIETTPHTAQVLDMSERSVKMKARQLGLKKMEKTRWLERADYIRNHFGHRSFAEIGKDLGVSREYVRRIAANMGLKRTPSEDFNLFSRIHTDIMRRERRRVIFGLSPITRIKVVSNRPESASVPGSGHRAMWPERNTAYSTIPIISVESRNRK